jgi:hypothetical protein
MTTEPTVPPDEYEPDESYIRDLFAPPPPRPNLPPVICGVAFNGCSPEEAERIRWAARYGEKL